MNHANTTLGELLSSKNETIRRNALSILKQLTKQDQTEVVRSWLETRKPELKGRIGISDKGLYMHNPATGFNETIDKNGNFTGKCPY